MDDFDREYHCGCDAYVFSANVEDIAIKESREKIRELQYKGEELLSYVNYLERGSLPEDAQLVKRIVLGSKNFEMIDGVLHYESPTSPGRWCTVVPRELQQQLLTEAHAGLFAGHFSEKKVYGKICRSYWWQGLRADVRRFCRSCLNCVSQRGPGYRQRPPMKPIPVKYPFHRVAVDVLQLYTQLGKTSRTYK